MTFTTESDFIRFCENNDLWSKTNPYVACFKPTSLKIKNVIFNYPATIVIWEDGTKTVVKATNNDVFDPEKGLAMAIVKKALGNKGNYYNTIKKWLPEEQTDAEPPKPIAKNVLYEEVDGGLRIRGEFVSNEEAQNLKAKFLDAVDKLVSDEDD